MLQVTPIKSLVSQASDIPGVLDSLQVPFETLSHANWADRYPYRPDVRFRLAYNAMSLLLHFKVQEDHVRAVYADDNGQVWTDSCVEFFSIPAGDGVYYNMECNCIGTVLLGAGRDREHRERANSDTLGSIQRWASLGRKPFEDIRQSTFWEVALVLPYTAFFKHRIRRLTGNVVKANFYKCGDGLSQPHFLSWQPISLENPNFHCPQFFGELAF